MAAALDAAVPDANPDPELDPESAPEPAPEVDPLPDPVPDPEPDPGLDPLVVPEPGLVPAPELVPLPEPVLPCARATKGIVPAAARLMPESARKTMRRCFIDLRVETHPEGWIGEASGSMTPLLLAGTFSRELLSNAAGCRFYGFPILWFFAAVLVRFSDCPLIR